MSKTIIITTTQRCGSTWMVNALVKSIETRWGTVPARIGGRPAQGGYLDGLELGFRVHERSLDEAPANLVQKLGMRRAVIPSVVPLVIKTHDISSRDFDFLSSIIDSVHFLTISRDFKDVLISRYFYYRYFWPSNPDLGPMPDYLAEVFSSIAHLADGDALCALARTSLIRNWASEWAAFETPFSTPKALRVWFDDMLSGSAFVSVSDFLQFKLSPGPSIEKRRLAEMRKNRRSESHCFHRRGASGEWRDWFSSSDVAFLDIAVKSAQEEHMRIQGLSSLVESRLGTQ